MMEGEKIAVREDSICLGANDVDGLETLGAFFDLELHLLVFDETTTSITADLRIVDEDIGACVLLDESPALFVVEPLHFAFGHDSSTLTLTGMATRRFRWIHPRDVPASGAKVDARSRDRQARHQNAEE